VIKALCTDGSVFLGLSHLNLERLKKGQGIRIQLADMGLPPLEVLIFADVDEATLVRKLRESGILPADLTPRPMDDPQSGSPH
jgi:hypothetical protein